MKALLFPILLVPGGLLAREPPTRRLGADPRQQLMPLTAAIEDAEFVCRHHLTGGEP